MARKSRKIDFVNVGKEELAAQTKSAPKINVSHAALYARLSFESEQNRERNTIETQMALLHNYVAEHNDIEVVNEYFDISKTGTNFEREGFEEMMLAIRNGDVDCVIVKDLSRLGRNYVEAGSYIERVFPFFDVRFISVNENFDSNRDPVDLLVGMTNICNEYYSRDLSKKVKSANRAYWAKGEIPTVNIPYGYQKDKDIQRHIVPNPETAPVIQKIFSLFADGAGYSEIARILEKDKILSPRGYKLKKLGRDYEEYSKFHWSSFMIRSILENQAYVGDIVHNRNKNDVWAECKCRKNPIEEWIVVENTHDALVTRDDFNSAQKRIKEIKRNSLESKNGSYSLSSMNLFKGKIVCFDCGHTMYLKGKASNKRRFDCGAHIYKKECFNHGITDVEVNDCVLRIIRTHIKSYLENVNMIRRLNMRQESIRKYDVFNKEINKCIKELELMKMRKEKLFDDYAHKLIDATQYETFLESDKTNEKELQDRLDLLLQKRVGYEKDFHTEPEWEQIINKYRNTRTLTKQMVDSFVEKVEISAGKKITVHLVYDDMLEKLKIYAEERNKKV